MLLDQPYSGSPTIGTRERFATKTQSSANPTSLLEPTCLDQQLPSHPQKQQRISRTWPLEIFLSVGSLPRWTLYSTSSSSSSRSLSSTLLVVRYPSSSPSTFSCTSSSSRTFPNRSQSSHTRSSRPRFLLSFVPFPLSLLLHLLDPPTRIPFPPFQQFLIWGFGASVGWGLQESELFFSLFSPVASHLFSLTLIPLNLQLFLGTRLEQDISKCGPSTLLLKDELPVLEIYSSTDSTLES